MVPNKHFKAGFQGNHTMVVLQLPVFFFQDENAIHYALLPSLDLMGYGNSAPEAEQSLAIVVKEYLDFTTKNNTLHKDLEEHGWKIQKRGKKILPPNIAKQICDNEQLNTILSERDFQKRDKEIRLPAFA